MDKVVAAFLAVESPAECAALLNAMLTPQELEQVPVRWELLNMLLRETMSQRKLASRAGVAPATAARAHKVFQSHEGLLRTIVGRIGSNLAVQRNGSVLASS
jgi:Trp operon repressor